MKGGSAGAPSAPPRPTPKPAPRPPVFDKTLLTPDVIAAFKEAGVTKKDLRNRATATIAMSLIEESFKQQEEEERRKNHLAAGSESLTLSLDSTVAECTKCGELYNVSSQCSCSSPRPAASPRPTPVARLHATERSPRAKSVQPLSRKSEGGDVSHKKAPTTVAPKPPVRLATPPPSQSPGREDPLSSPTSNLKILSQPISLSSSPPPPLSSSPPPSSAGRLAKQDAPGSPVAEVAVGRGRGRGTGRGHVMLSPAGERRSAAPPQAQTASGIDIAVLPPPPVLPAQVAEVMNRRNSVVEPPRISAVRQTLERRSTISDSSGLIQQMARRSQSVEVGEEAAASRTISSLPAHMQQAPAPLMRRSASAVLASNVPAPPPSPPPPVVVVVTSASVSATSEEGGSGGSGGGDVFAELLRGKALRAVNTTANKRLSHRNAGQLAAALSEALARMRPSMEDSVFDDDEEDDSDDW
jgi:hypothetical protein